MKFILSFISLAVGSAFAQIYFPWWTMAIGETTETGFDAVVRVTKDIFLPDQ